MVKFRIHAGSIITYMCRQDVACEAFHKAGAQGRILEAVRDCLSKGSSIAGHARLQDVVHTALGALRNIVLGSVPYTMRIAEAPREQHSVLLELLASNDSETVCAAACCLSAIADCTPAMLLMKWPLERPTITTVVRALRNNNISGNSEACENLWQSLGNLLLRVFQEPEIAKSALVACAVECGVPDLLSEMLG